MKNPILPSNIAIACALSEMRLELDRHDLPNFENDCLEEAHQHLSKEPPDIQAAKTVFAKGMAHAFFRPGFKETRPEAMLIAACDELLRDVK